MKMPLRRVLPGVSATLGLMAAALVLLPGPAAANGPTKYGWWYEANAGLPLAPPPPPQVPSDGMYAANGFSGPTAISALTFTVPSGAQLGPMTLKIAGTPTMTQAPLACTLSAGSAGYRATEDGSWRDRPSYDCRKAQMIGTVDAAKTTVTFNVDPFLANGTVAVVILAGGSADEIAFQKPDDGTLRIATGDTGAGPAATAAAPAGSAGTSDLPAQSSASPEGSALPALDAGAGLGLTGPAAPAAPGGPPAATPPSGSGSSAAPGYALAQPAAATAHPGWHTRVATVLGLTAILLALVAWTLGYGPLGGRVQPLSVRLRPPSAPEGDEGRP